MKRALVTGAAGFLGSHLVDLLLFHGFSVVGTDNLSTGNMRNLRQARENKNFGFVEIDVMRSHLALGKFDYIYNLACPASPPKYQADPWKTLETSVMGIRNMIELARQNGAVLLQASTSEIYGNPLVHPQSELYWGNVNPVGIRSCYDEGKRVAETYMYEYGRQGGNVRIARIFNTYGPRMDSEDGRVVSNFICQALRGEDITIYGDGTQTRSFTFYTDTVRGLFDLSRSDYPSPTNIGNNVEFTVAQLAEQIIKLTGSNSRIVYNELPGDDPLQRKPDLGVASQMLGWKPSVMLGDGLPITIDYFKEVIGG